MIINIIDKNGDTKTVKFRRTGNLVNIDLRTDTEICCGGSGVEGPYKLSWDVCDDGYTPPIDVSDTVQCMKIDPEYPVQLDESDPPKIQYETAPQPVATFSGRFTVLPESGWPQLIAEGFTPIFQSVLDGSNLTDFNSGQFVVIPEIRAVVLETGGVIYVDAAKYNERDCYISPSFSVEPGLTVEFSGSFHYGDVVYEGRFCDIISTGTDSFIEGMTRYLAVFDAAGNQVQDVSWILPDETGAWDEDRQQWRWRVIYTPQSDGRLRADISTFLNPSEIVQAIDAHVGGVPVGAGTLIINEVDA